MLALTTADATLLSTWFRRPPKNEACSITNGLFGVFISFEESKGI